MPADRDIKKLAQTIAMRCIGVRVRLLGRFVTRVYDEALRPLGVTVSQMNILTVIALRGPMQPSKIVGILSIEKSTLSRNVCLMEEKGWIRSQSGQKRNTRLLSLSKQGQQLYERAAPAWHAAQGKLTSLLGDDTISALRLAAVRVREMEAAT